ncbi:MAG: hexose kinase [Tepidisphaeraceae bacterium]
MHLCLGTTPTVQQTMIFPHVVPDEVNRAVEVRRSAAGKPINVARVLHALGDEAILCVPLGGDTGRFILADIAAAGIAHDCVDSPHPTRTCVTIIDRKAATVTELVEEHAPLPEQMAGQLLAILSKHLPQCRSVILSGTVAPGAGDDFYADCCRASAGANVPVILDAHGQPLLRALRFHPLIVKPNRAELASMMGTRIDDDDSLRHAMIDLVRRGAQWAIITLGRNGAVASDGKSFWKVPALQVPAISPIGSGDAFAAGVASSVAAGRDIPHACLLATACAAANTLVPGAGFLRMEDVHRLEPLARIQKW